MGRTAFSDWHGLSLILARINICIHYKAWNYITYPFPNFNGPSAEVWEWISNFILHFAGHLIIYYTGIENNPYL